MTNAASAETILRWYTYRWYVEEYHKILKSGTQAESYRLAATSMEAILGFLKVIAVELLLSWALIERFWHLANCGSRAYKSSDTFLI